MNPPPLQLRIAALHAWYARNVMNLRQTPEAERLWFEWLKAGFNGNDLRAVILYIRRQISLGKRNEGALKLSNLLARDESGGFLKFEEDLGLATSRKNLSIDKRLEPSPEAATGLPLLGERAGVRASTTSTPYTRDPAAAEQAMRDLKNWNAPPK